MWKIAKLSNCVSLISGHSEETAFVILKHLYKSTFTPSLNLDKFTLLANIETYRVLENVLLTSSTSRVMFSALKLITKMLQYHVKLLPEDVCLICTKTTLPSTVLYFLLNKLELLHKHELLMNVHFEGLVGFWTLLYKLIKVVINLPGISIKTLTPTRLMSSFIHVLNEFIKGNMYTNQSLNDKPIVCVMYVMMNLKLQNKFFLEFLDFSGTLFFVKCLNIIFVNTKLYFTKYIQLCFINITYEIFKMKPFYIDDNIYWTITSVIMNNTTNINKIVMNAAYQLIIEITSIKYSCSNEAAALIHLSYSKSLCLKSKNICRFSFWHKFSENNSIHSPCCLRKSSSSSLKSNTMLESSSIALANERFDMIISTNSVNQLFERPHCHNNTYKENHFYSNSYNNSTYKMEKYFYFADCLKENSRTSTPKTHIIC